MQVGFTETEITVSPDVGSFEVEVSVLSGTLTENVTLVCISVDGTAQGTTTNSVPFSLFQ